MDLTITRASAQTRRVGPGSGAAIALPKEEMRLFAFSPPCRQLRTDVFTVTPGNPQRLPPVVARYMFISGVAEIP
ncbi:MAG: hypothetical protein JWQ73_1418 [Variovorax sp.]|nr:hypothetical protein [Variovorax sp.]